LSTFKQFGELNGLNPDQYVRLLNLPDKQATVEEIKADIFKN